MSKPLEIDEYAERQLRRFRSNLREALGSGDVEAVHQVRVSSRRLEEPLELARPWASSKDVDRLQKKLKRVRRAFTDTRDLDVLNLSLSNRPGDGVEPTDLAELTRIVAIERADALSKAAKKCTRFSSADLEDAVRCVFERVESETRSQVDWAFPRLHGLIGQRAQSVLDESPADACRSDLHRIRVGLKKLRYALELQVAVEPGERQAMIEQFKHIQGLLGEWNDELQAATRLSNWACRREQMIERPAFSAALLGHARRRIEHARELTECFLAEWPGFKNTVRSLAAGG